MPSPDEPPLRPGGALFLVLVQFAGSLGALLVSFATSRGQAAPLLGAVAAVLVGPLLALYVGLRRFAPASSTRQALGLGGPSARQWSTIGLAVVAGAALSPLTRDLALRWMSVLPRPAPSEELAESLALETPGFAVLVIMLVVHLVGAPLVRELLFRGLIQPRLVRAVGAPKALLYTAGLYAVAQHGPAELPVGLLVGLLAGLLAWGSGTTWAPLAAHVAHVAAPLALGAAGWPIAPGPPPIIVYLPAPVVVAGIGVTIGATYLAVRIGRDQPSLRARQ